MQSNTISIASIKSEQLMDSRWGFADDLGLQLFPLLEESQSVKLLVFHLLLPNQSVAQDFATYLFKNLRVRPDKTSAVLINRLFSQLTRQQSESR